MSLLKIKELMMDALASQGEAETGTENTKMMSPLRTKQSITANAPPEVIASQGEAEAGTENTKMMTSLRVKQSVSYNAPPEVIASQGEAEAGSENTKMMTALRVKQSIDQNAPPEVIASQAEAEVGTENTKMMTALRTANAIAASSLVGVFGSKLIHIQDEKTSGTDGGIFNSGAWQTRDVNTVKTDDLKFSIRNDDYKWTASGSGTNEYYLEAIAGGDPGIAEPNTVYESGVTGKMDIGTMGSLAVGEWDWGDNDTLGFSTVYVRLTDEVDPDIKVADFMEASLVGVYSNQITLQPGEYFIEAQAPAHRVDSHRAELYDTTGVIVLISGSSENTEDASSVVTTTSKLKGRFTLYMESVLIIRHRCLKSRATDGFGKNFGISGEEIYTQALIWKIS